MVFASQRDGRAQVPMAAIGRFSWRKGLLYCLYSTDRTVKTLIKVSAWSSLYRMYLHAHSGGYGFRYVGLPDGFKSASNGPYDPQEMRRMFDIGFEMGRAGRGWETVPPGF